ncbi:MAG: YlxQ-related RNA-binding protein [Streptococcaceae bacterium]|jgi:ribosomal protein L7Ae-like RNA K-turn-binding protein|nr:YlxQ-related RNA-binding protein [Streptococcaceae bacterium]
MTQLTDFNKTKVLNALGMAKKAGKLVTGEALVIKSIQAERARLVFVAKDAAPNLLKRLTDKTTYYEIPMLDIFSTAELSHAIGSERKVIAVQDKGFAKKMESLMK